MICAQLYGFKYSYLTLIISDRSIFPIDETLLGTPTPGQSGPGSNGIEKVTLYVQELEPHHSMKFSAISGTHIGGRQTLVRVLTTNEEMTK